MPDPIWISIALSCLAALLAAFAALWSRAAARGPELAGALDDLRRDLASLRSDLAEDGRRARDEAGTQSRGLREEVDGRLDRLGTALGAMLERLGKAQGERVDKVATHVQGLAESTERRLGEMRRDGEAGGKELREEVGTQVRAFGELLGSRLDGSAAAQTESLDKVGDTIRRLVQTNAEAHEGLRTAVEGRLDTLRQDNARKLEEMRQTVDEKLQGTLETRLGEKFKVVSEHLEKVHRSVGEMQALATGVGDLKRVLTNVKSRGTWAEVSLGSLLDQALSPEQFGRNVETVAGSGERVEFAVRLPGQGEGDTVWLPIDAKFPVEDYERLLDASDRCDAAGVESALRGLETRMKLEGAKICQKYLSPPATTDFGILYVPTEGLYAEVLRRPGLVDHLQGQCRIMVAGPTNLHAFLTSLRMGFRTLAIERRSSEVWQTLGAVRTEFGKYGDVMDKVKKKLEEAGKHIDTVATRTRAIDRKLRSVERLPDEAATALLALEDFAHPDDETLQAAE